MITANPDPTDHDSSSIEVLDPQDVLGIGRGTDILVVDDDPGNLAAYEAVLAPLGRRLVLAHSGMEAFSRLLEQDFALMMLDVSMPDLDGIETARMVRQRDRCKGMPIIFVTGRTWDEDVVVEAYRLGALEFLTKPIVPEVLRAKVRIYLQLQEREQGMARQAAQLREIERRERERVRQLLATTNRLEKLQEATAALAEAQSPGAVAEVVVRLGAEAVDATSAVMWLEGTDGALSVAASHRVPAAYLDQFRTVTVDSSLPLIRVFQTQQTIWVEDAADFAREAPTVVDHARAADRLSSFVAMPVVCRQRPAGVVTFSYAGEHRFTDEERRFLRALTSATSQALERALAEREARRTVEAEGKRKDEFLAMLGHELRNPLFAIASAFELLKMRDRPSRELAVLGRQIDHLNQLISGLVDVSRITQGKVTLRREATELAEAVTHAVEGVRALITTREHKLVVDCPPGLVVDADRVRLCQVLGNLLTNAAKYTPPRGRIEVVARGAEDAVTITVTDTGRGITEPLLTTMFDMFVQDERSLDRRDGGLGVGLTVVRNMVEQHGGTVRAQSAGAGRGATFEVRWPRATALTPSAPHVAHAVPKTSSYRFLIVDDNNDAADLLAAIARELGHDAVATSDGEQAVRVAAEVVPHFALVDVSVPDSYAVALRIKEVTACADTVLIAVTEYGQPPDPQQFAQVGFAREVMKPVDMQALVSLLGIDDHGPR